jgi:hypothetical protein
MTAEAPAPSFTARLREAITDALKYWELRRLIYNGVLAVIVLFYFFMAWPASYQRMDFDSILGLFILAVVANICYCAAYVGDIFVQMSGFREAWRKWRWVLFAIGLIFASIFTRFVAKGWFGVSAC